MDSLMDQISDPSAIERESLGEPPARPRRRSWRTAVTAVITVLALTVLYVGFGSQRSGKTAAAPPPAPPVTVSQPLQREVDTRVGFLGQFSAIDRVELRAQVGGTLAEIHFKDGDIVHKGDLLFTIDPRPYEIRLAQANAQLETAAARLVLADRELARAQTLQRTLAGTAQNVD